MSQRFGKTLVLDSAPSITSYSAYVGKKEGEGPLSRHFDHIYSDTSCGQESWEKAESLMQKECAANTLEKAKLNASDVQYIFAGDLLNQSISSTYGLREMDIPFIGLYGACSTMAESLGLGAVFVDAGAADNCLCVTSSHFCSAERQFRFPLEYGGQRTPTSQWTATAAGSAIVGKSKEAPFVRAVTFGAITDMGIKDISNMGAAMAPAAASTIKQYLDDTGSKPEQFDLILTGDLGELGGALLLDLLGRENIDISKQHSDCGLLLYDKDSQNVDAGGSGCGCSASVLCSYILTRVKENVLNNILFIATGALMSTVSVQQGETIPSVAHLIHISNTNR